MSKKSKVRELATFGDDVLAGLKDFVTRCENQEPITIRTVHLDLTPAEYSADDVRRLRQSLGVSQAVFAKLLAVSAKLVQHWERGERIPQPLARRLLDEIRANPDRWRAKLTEIPAASAPAGLSK